MPERYFVNLNQRPALSYGFGTPRPYMTMAEICWQKKQRFETQCSVAHWRRVGGGGVA